MMLEGKVAVVTGAGGGIGREVAIAMALEGAAIVVNDIGASLAGEGLSDTPGEQTRQIIEQRGGRAVTNRDSVADWASAQRIVQAAMDAFGRVDIVVNNAGILRDVIFHKMSPQDWLDVINVHLNGSFFVSRAAAPLFRAQESGAYVHMTSTSGLIGNFGQANYSAAKLGIAALSKSIALESHDQLDPGRDPGAAGPRGQAAADDAGQERPDGRLSRVRRRARHHRPDLRHPLQRDLPDGPEPPAAQRASRRGVDAVHHRRARRPGAPLEPGRNGPQRRRVQLGPRLNVQFDRDRDVVGAAFPVAGVDQHLVPP